MTDKQLLKLVTSFRKGILGKYGKPDNKCYMVCHPLQSYLSYFANLKTDLIEFEIPFGDSIFGHWVLLMQDGRIIDPTASQFNHHYELADRMPDVFIGHPPVKYLENHLKIAKERGIEIIGG